MADPKPNQPPEEPKEPTRQDRLRESLADTIAVLEGVGPLCGDIDEMVDMLTLALKNDAQLAMIEKHMTPPRMRR